VMAKEYEKVLKVCLDSPPSPPGHLKFVLILSHLWEIVDCI